MIRALNRASAAHSLQAIPTCRSRAVRGTSEFCPKPQSLRRATANKIDRQGEFPTLPVTFSGMHFVYH
jgi:hypothetical protein